MPLPMFQIKTRERPFLRPRLHTGPRYQEIELVRGELPNAIYVWTHQTRGRLHTPGHGNHGWRLHHKWVVPSEVLVVTVLPVCDVGNAKCTRVRSVPTDASATCLLCALVAYPRLSMDAYSRCYRKCSKLTNRTYTAGNKECKRSSPGWTRKWLRYSVNPRIKSLRSSLC